MNCQTLAASVRIPNLQRKLTAGLNSISAKAALIGPIGFTALLSHVRWHPSNENKMSDGHREWRLLGMETH